MKITKSKFRHSGWMELATGIVSEFYGDDMPAQDGTFSKLWDHMVDETITVSDYVAPVAVVAVP